MLTSKDTVFWSRKIDGIYNSYAANEAITKYQRRPWRTVEVSVCRLRKLAQREYH